MKIAVASSGRWLDSIVDEHTGRAAFFIIYDTDTESFESVDNWRAIECIHWAGPQTADLLINAGTEVTIVKRIGASAFRRLTRSKIDLFYVGNVTVVEAIRRFREGGLKQALAPNCEGHGHIA